MNSIDLNVSGINHQWARFLIAELVRQGVNNFVVSTGSRNTPLMLALADMKECYGSALQIIVHSDERGAAFFALGHSRASSKPSALICASGTAVANYYPAIIEASMSYVPLIIISADRPIEVRDAQTDQVIDQRNIYSSFLRWSFDIPAAQKNLCPAYLLTAVDQAVSKSVNTPCGPVHLNFCSRKPHITLPEDKVFYMSSPAIENWKSSNQPFTSYFSCEKTISSSVLKSITDTLVSAKRGLIVCSGLSPHGDGGAILQLAKTLQFPLFADITSGLRFCAKQLNDNSPIVSHFELYLQNEEIASRLIPDVVLHFGSEPVNETVQRYLHSTTSSYILVNNHPNRQDPGQLVSLRVDAEPFSFAKTLYDYVDSSSLCFKSSQLLEPILIADRTATDILNQEKTQFSHFSERQIIVEIVKHILPNSGLFLGNSLPVRQSDRFTSLFSKKLYVSCNRGVSGIDGNLASGIGFAAGLKRPTTIFTGDLAFIHDLNSLLLLKQSEIPVTIVIPNNDGGEIFTYLPVVSRLSCFEQMFIAPHGLCFKDAASFFGLPYYFVETHLDFVHAYKTALSIKQSSLIEVKINRDESFADYKNICKMIVKQIEEKNILADFRRDKLRSLA